MPRTFNKIADYFHNSEHSPEGLNHCHSEGNHPYTIKHFNGKHVISNPIAQGHGRGNKPQWFKFTEQLGDGWNLESGEKIDSPPENKTKEASNMSMSAKDKQTLLQNSLMAEYKIGETPVIPKSLTIEEVFDDHVVYNVDGQLYQTNYTLDEKNKPVYSDPQKVTSTKVFKAMESLRETYSEMIQEAGKRNAMKDAARVKKILELCQELLSNEIEPDEKKAKEAMKEATAVLTLIKEQAVMKTEDGVQFPAAAYAYVPDAEKSTTWKLRLWEDPEKKVTRAQLGAAAAAFSPGGFRGQRVQIPAADIAGVKRKIRAEYRKLGVEAEDMPRSVRESWTEVPGKGTVWEGLDEMRERILNFVPLTEAKFDKGRATVIIIKPGFNATEDRYYPAEMLKRDYKVFDGQKMYADHPTESEDKERPERSIRDWVATLSDVAVDESGVVTGVAEILEPWLMTKLANLREKGMLSEMGISINAIGVASKATIDGKETLVIEELTDARSVDFVTEPGAGGVVTLYESDRNRDIDLIELSALREKRPDLVKIIESGVRAEITKEVKKAMDNEELIKEKDTQIEALTKERDTLKEVAEKAEKDKAKAEAQATIKEAVDKAELPSAAKERLIERFKDAESADEIAEAITSEVDYIAKLAESGKVKGLGPSAPEGNKDADRKAFKESLKLSNPDWSEEQLEAAVSGR